MDNFLVSNLPYIFDYISNLNREQWPDELSSVFWKLVNDEVSKLGISTPAMMKEMKRLGGKIRLFPY